MSGACAGYDSLRNIDIDRVDGDGVDDIRRADQETRSAEQQSFHGAALQHELGEGALADATLPPPRARATAERKSDGDDAPDLAESRVLGRAAIHSADGDIDRAQSNGDEPTSAEAADDREDSVLVAGSALEESKDEKKEDAEGLYEYDETKDFPDSRTGTLPQGLEEIYKMTALDGPKAEILTAEQEVDLAKEIEAGLLADKLVGILDGTLDLSEMDENVAAKLTATAERYRDRQNELEEMAKVGKEAKDAFIGHNLRLAFKEGMKRAHATQGRSVDQPMDLVARANDGVIHAAEKFDYTKGYKFSTYATPWIKQAMDRGRQHGERTVRLPVHVEEGINTVNKAERTVLSRLQPGDEVTPEAIAAEIGGKMTADKVTELLSYRKQALSLNQVVTDGEGQEYGDGIIIEDQTADDTTAGLYPDPVAQAALARVEAEERADIDEQLRGLLGDNSNLYQTIVLRFGLGGNAPHTLDQIGAQLGKDRETVRQWQNRALKILQDPDNRWLFERFR